MPKKSYECCLFTSMIIEIVLIGVTIQYGFKYNNSLKYNKLKCNITKIEYPIEISNSINENNNNFVKCSCGKRCTSDMGICTKLFTNNKNFEEILIQNNYDTYLSKCTFAETRCQNGELIKNRIYAIKENIKNIKNKYEISSFIDCYEYDNIYFLDDYNYINETIILSIFGGILLIIISLILICCPPQ